MSEKLIKFPPETSKQRLVAEVWFILIMTMIVGFFGVYAAVDVFFTIILSICFGINIVILSFGAVKAKKRT